MNRITRAAAGAALSLTASAALLAPTAANAGVVWLTQLNWAQAGHAPGNTSYGSVKIEEVDANDLRVTVRLTSPTMFSDNGNGHVMFAFNVWDTPDSTFSVDPLSQVLASQVNPPSGSTDGPSSDPVPGHGNFSNQPFGYFDNAFEILPSAPNTLPSPFIFNIHNNGGITFAGVGYQTDSSGKLTVLGTGNHLFSNSNGSVPGSPTGGWWFAADTSGSGGCTSGITCAVAGRDAFLLATSTNGLVPEPDTWALMILGFGATGVMLRRRRAVRLAA